MKNQKKIQNCEEWLQIFQKNIEISVSAFKEPEQQLFTQALLSCQNDYLFNMLIINSVDKNDTNHFINQSNLFDKWKLYEPSQGSFANHIANCQNDEPFYPLSFRIFLNNFEVFKKNSHHPLHIPKNFSFFFNTLFSSWVGRLYVPIGMHAHAMTILDLWDNFQNQIRSRCSSPAHSKSGFYCTEKFNLKLFRFLFSVDSEIAKQSLKSLKCDIPACTYLGNYFSRTEFAKVEYTILQAQQKIPYPHLQQFIINTFKEQLTNVYYTSDDFENPDLFPISGTKLVKYRNCNDDMINSLIQRLRQLIIDFKEFFEQIKKIYTTTVEQNGINITCLKSDYNLDEYKIFTYHEFVHLCAIMHDEICLAESEFNKNSNIRIFSPKVFQIINSFFDKFKNQWPQVHKQHIHKLRYNSQPSLNARRKATMIEQNAHSFYPIDEFLDDILKQLSPPQVLDDAQQKISLQGKIEKVTAKAPEFSPIFSKQEKIDTLCEQTEASILQYANILNCLDPSIPILECSAESIFKYLCKQDYFKSTSNKKEIHNI